MEKRTSKLRLVLTAAAILLLASLQAELAAASSHLEFSRPNLVGDPRRINLLRFRCVNAENGRPISGASFFLEGEVFFDFTNPQTTSEDRPVERVVVDGDSIQFFINRRAEGAYSCGVEGDISPAEQFLGEYIYDMRVFIL